MFSPSPGPDIIPRLHDAKVNGMAPARHKPQRGGGGRRRALRAVLVVQGRMMDGVPKAWLDELNDRFALVTVPMGALLCSARWPRPPIVVERLATIIWSKCWSWRKLQGRGRCSSTRRLGTLAFSNMRGGLSTIQKGSLSAGRQERDRALSKTGLKHLGFAGRKSVKLAEPY